MIYRVFNRLHMRFIEAPIASARNVFATTPPVKVESRTENVFTKLFIRATDYIIKFILLTAVW